jgi:hypothetical protein
MIPGGKSPLMAGIVSGHPRKVVKPVIDGIYTGVPKGNSTGIGETHKITASATQKSVGQFGGLSAPEGKGNGGR